MPLPTGITVMVMSASMMVRRRPMRGDPKQGIVISDYEVGEDDE